MFPLIVLYIVIHILLAGFFLHFRPGFGVFCSRRGRRTSPVSRMRIVTSPTPRARFAFPSHPSLEENGCLVELLALNLRQLVSVDPFFLIRLSVEVRFTIIGLLGLFATSCLVAKRISHTACFTPMAVEAGFPPSPV